MILADKIIALRKKNGWSQEELAERLGVTRQAVSKWEGNQSTPDLDKLLLMSQVFGVSTDLLLKEELDVTEEPGHAAPQPAPAVSAPIPSAPAPAPKSARKVSLPEATAFLAAVQAHVRFLALGVALCILSPIPLLALNAAAHSRGGAHDPAVALGIAALLLMVAPAVGLFIFFGNAMKPYEYLEREPIDAAPGVAELAREWQDRLQSRHTLFLIAGVCLCILAALPLLCTGILSQELRLHMAAVCLLLVLVAVAVALFILAGVPWGATEKLLQEGAYTPQHKRAEPLIGAIAAIYWPAVVALFLLAGFTQGKWQWAGIIFPVAGVLFGSIAGIINFIAARRE